MKCAEWMASKIGEEIGYPWCTEELKRNGFVDAAHRVLLSQADSFVSQCRFSEAIEIYKVEICVQNDQRCFQRLEKVDPNLECFVSKRLACLCSLDDQTEEATKHSQIALSLDRYDMEGWVTEGNVAFMEGDLNRAKNCYEEAKKLHPGSIEALYNLG